MKKCEVCGNKFYSYSKIVNLNLCSKHYAQVYRNGKILNRTMYDPNEIILKDNYAYILIYDKYGNTKDDYILIDLDDVDRCSKHKWSEKSEGYIQTDISGKKMSLHQFIMNNPKTRIDHINGDRKDNRKCNLRIVTNQENIFNCRLTSNTISKRRGITWDSKNKGWRARIGINYKSIYLGTFENKLDAIKARENAEIKYFGQYRRINT
ncbi:MAG: HNH endonuclease [Candidatus Pacebacteria bacterium]|nr:HNH endonuclease [Candidatus Paceibacterota bacterium]